MGQSTDAYLVFGYPIEGEGEFEPYSDIEETLYNRNDPVELIIHCSGEYPMWILGMRGYLRAWRGTPVQVDPSKLQVEDGWIGRIRAVAQEFDLEIEPEKIAWYLVSYWG